jgi:hypothetical protein
VKTVWLVVVLSLSSIVAYTYSGLLDVLNNAGLSLISIPATLSVAATPPLHNAPAGVIAFDASSIGPAPGSTSNDGSLAADEYVFLHKTSNESLSAATASGLGIPWRWLRLYAVTPRPTESR